MEQLPSFLPQFSSLFRVMKVHLRVGGGRIRLAEMGGGPLSSWHNTLDFVDPWKNSQCMMARKVKSGKHG